MKEGGEREKKEGGVYSCSSLKQPSSFSSPDISNERWPKELIGDKVRFDASSVSAVREISSISSIGYLIGSKEAPFAASLVSVIRKPSRESAVSV